MTYFYINLKEVQNANQNFDNAFQKLGISKSRFERVRRRIENEMPQLSSNLMYIGTSLDEERKTGQKYQETLREIADFYKKYENEILVHKASAEEASENKSADKAVDPASENNSDRKIWELLKSLLKWADKTGNGAIADAAGNGLSYLESLYKFFTGEMKGITGAKDWCDLSDKSIGLWTALYEYLKKFYHETGDIFSAANQIRVKKLGLGGNVLDFIGSIFGAVDTIYNTKDIGTAGIIGQLFETSGSVVDIWESLEKLSDTNGVSEGGIYSPLKFYTTIAKSYLSALGQGFISYEKYSADGVWDLKDTGATGLEMSVKGLYSMVSSLTFGLLSEGTTGVSADSISSALESGCDDIGTQAGHYILNNPDLHQRYQNSNTVGKAAISFYAAFKVRWFNGG